MICLYCTVREECREYRKITASDHGVWGGELYTRKETPEQDEA